jgi:transporter family-2 protein
VSNLSLLAFSAGAAIAVQAVMNAWLGVLLKSAMLGAGIAFLSACVFTVAAVLLSARQYPQLADVSGGALSAFGVGVFYYLIPKMGVGSMMSYALSGQILMAVVASHFGWFDQPVAPVSVIKIVGVISLITGIVLINWEPGYAAARG